ncbi:unnamed protein product [Vicia faba]|uniref:Uncharacterized protein n=1 Tax=Vicia faba TaxID=3906 RepID=A0AAV0ZKF2_VICFA|nr:unnamed protein product [Vicia faba]
MIFVSAEKKENVEANPQSTITLSRSDLLETPSLDLLHATRLRTLRSPQTPGQPSHTESRILFTVGVCVSNRLQPPFTIMDEFAFEHEKMEFASVCLERG